MCIECKPCEICKEKGNDVRSFFCSFFLKNYNCLYRQNCCSVTIVIEVGAYLAYNVLSLPHMLIGWHYDCLDPPLCNTPDGDWNCPMCPSIEEQGCSGSSHFGQSPEVDIGERLLEEEFVDDVVSVATPARSRGRPSHTRSRRIAISLQNTASTSARRPRLKSNGSSAQSSRGERLTLKLRLQAKEERLSLSPFESFLKEEERDTSKTSITSEDKTRFEKSRIAAEVSLLSLGPYSVFL